MKKLLSLLALLAILTAYTAGHREGVRHAVEDSTVWAVECYDPDNPDETRRDDGTDLTIYIDLDGETYEHGMIQG